MGRKEIIYIHTRNYKPPKKELLKSWQEALAHTIKRDYSDISAKKFQSTLQDMAYYGDISYKFLSKVDAKNKKEPYE